jgi:hypothetical protein
VGGHPNFQLRVLLKEWAKQSREHILCDS